MNYKDYREELEKMGIRLEEMNKKVQAAPLPPIEGGAAMAATIVVPLALEFGPVLINWAMKIYEQHSRDPQTPEQKRAAYADIANRLEAANTIVQNAPQPPPGSGR